MNIAGFYIPPKPTKNTTEPTTESPEPTGIANLSLNSSTDNQFNTSSDFNESKEGEEEKGEEDEEEIGVGENADEDEDDNIGWITPSNLEEVKKLNGVHGDEQDIEEQLQMPVGCMTSDFSMQNVLIQIGIPVLSVDGLLIRRPRSYVLKCVTCSK